MQCRAHDSVRSRFEQNQPFAAMQRYAGNTGDAALAHRFANDPEGLLSNLVVGDNKIRLIEIDRVDLRSCHEFFYIDRVGAFDIDRGQFLVAYDDVIALCDFIAFDPVIAIDDPSRFIIDILLFEPVPGRALQKVEGNFFLVAGRGEQFNGTRDKRQLEVTFPILPVVACRTSKRNARTRRRPYNAGSAFPVPGSGPFSEPAGQ
jgi:hypothetical protein